VHAHPKHGQTVEGKTDTEVVNDGDIDVARVETEVAFVVCASGFQDESDDSENWF
jgi:hypothetical protein